MIGRERYAINRTIQLKRNIERKRDIDTAIIDALVGLQNETSEFAGLLGDRATAIEERFGIPEDGRISDQMYRAQEAMLASVDSLASAEYEIAVLQEKDAVRYLIDARQVLENARPGDGPALAQFRRAGRGLFRKMRKPKNDQERTREITRRLKQAAREQFDLMEKVTDLIPPEMPELEEEEEEEEEVDEEDQEQVDEEAVDQEDPEGEEGQSEEDELDEFDQAEAMADLRDEIQEKQADLAVEVDDIAELINELAQVSELAKQRAERAVQQVEKVNDAMARGNTERAMEEGGMASSALQVLANNIKGVTANEAAKRLGVARDLSMALTEDLRQLGTELEDAGESAKESDLDTEALKEFETNLASQPSETAREQGENAMSVEDILKSILDPEQGIIDPEDEMVKRLQQLISESKLDESVGRTGELPEVIDSLQWEDAVAETSDLADRFDVFSQRLDAMHREMLSPRIEQLRKLEQRAVETREKLKSLQTEDQISRWHERADGLVEDVESAEIAEKQTDKIRESMAEAGWESSTAKSWGWKPTNRGDVLLPPEEYDSDLENLVGEIRRHIAELAIVGVANANEGNVPPKYKHLVDRYLEVLAGAGDDNDKDDLN